MKGRTVFVIAHRLSTIRNSDAIIVLEHGKIIERGDHEDLIKNKGTYYQLYTGNGYFSEKRGLKNIYEKLCLKYSKIPGSFNV